MPSNLEWEREPPLFPEVEPLPSLPPRSQQQISTLLQEQPAVQVALRVLALMPLVGVPWTWVDELVSDCGTQLEQGAPDLRGLLEPTGLVVTLSEHPVARLYPDVAVLVEGGPQDAQAQEIFAAGRRLAARRLEEIRAERLRRFHILKAEGRDPTVRTPAKTYRTSSKVRAIFLKHNMPYAIQGEIRQAPAECGSTAASPDAAAPDPDRWPDYGWWEQPYLHAFMRDELQRGTVEGLEWVLGISWTPDPILELARAPIDRLLESRPEGWEELRLKCLYLFEDGKRRSMKNPYGRGGCGPLNEALEILRAARPHHPNSREFEKLWTEACRLYDLYDW
jgi:hypothetical protein